MTYTFSVTGTDGIIYYPLDFLWKDKDNQIGVGMLDFIWTPDIKLARTWPEQDMAETIAIEFYDTEIIEINENGEYKIKKDNKCVQK